MAADARIAAFGVALSGDCGSRVADQIGGSGAHAPRSSVTFCFSPPAAKQDCLTSRLRWHPNGLRSS